MDQATETLTASVSVASVNDALNPGDLLERVIEERSTRKTSSSSVPLPLLPSPAGSATRPASGRPSPHELERSRAVLALQSELEALRRRNTLLEASEPPPAQESKSEGSTPLKSSPPPAPQTLVIVECCPSEAMPRKIVDGRGGMAEGFTVRPPVGRGAGPGVGDLHRQRALLALEEENARLRKEAEQVKEKAAEAERDLHRRILELHVQTDAAERAGAQHERFADRASAALGDRLRLLRARALLQRAFFGWRSLALAAFKRRAAEHAGDLVVEGRARRAMRAWRDRAERKAAVRRRRTHLLRLHREGRARRALQAWQAAAVRGQELRGILARQAARRRRATLRAALAAWKTGSAAARVEAAGVREYHLTRALRRAFSAWRSWALEMRRRRQWAEERGRWLDRVWLQRVLLAWRMAAANARAAEAQRERGRLRALFGTWRAAAEAAVRARERADRAVFARACGVQRQALRAWLGAMWDARGRRAKVARAVARRARIAQASVMTAWLHVAHRARKLRAIVRTVERDRRRKVLGAWRASFLKRRWAKGQVQAAAGRRRRAVLRRALFAWWAETGFAAADRAVKDAKDGARAAAEAQAAARDLSQDLAAAQAAKEAALCHAALAHSRVGWLCSGPEDALLGPRLRWRVARTDPGPAVSISKRERHGAFYLCPPVDGSAGGSTITRVVESRANGLSTVTYSVERALRGFLAVHGGVDGETWLGGTILLAHRPRHQLKVTCRVAATVAEADAAPPTVLTTTTVTTTAAAEDSPTTSDLIHDALKGLKSASPDGAATVETLAVEEGPADEWALEHYELQGAPPSHRRDFGACQAGPTRFVVIGGWDGKNDLMDVHVADLAYDPPTALNPTLTWTLHAPRNKGPSPRSHPGLAYDPATDSVLLFGGYCNARNCALDDFWIYSLQHRTWWYPQTRGPMPPARRGHVCAVIGRELVVHGGFYGATRVTAADPEHHLGDLWAINLDTLTWRRVDPTPGTLVPSPRRQHAGASLGPHLLLHGGYNGQCHLNDLWTLDLSDATPTWRALRMHTGDGASVPIARSCHSATLVGCELAVLGGVAQGGTEVPGLLHLIHNPCVLQGSEAADRMVAAEAENAALRAHTAQLGKAAGRTAGQLAAAKGLLDRLRAKAKELAARDAGLTEELARTAAVAEAATARLLAADARALGLEGVVRDLERRLARTREALQEALGGCQEGRAALVGALAEAQKSGRAGLETANKLRAALAEVSRRDATLLEARQRLAYAERAVTVARAAADSALDNAERTTHRAYAARSAGAERLEGEIFELQERLAAEAGHRRDVERSLDALRAERSEHAAMRGVAETRAAALQAQLTAQTARTRELEDRAAALQAEVEVLRAAREAHRQAEALQARERAAMHERESASASPAPAIPPASLQAELQSLRARGAELTQQLMRAEMERDAALQLAEGAKKDRAALEEKFVAEVAAIERAAAMRIDAIRRQVDHSLFGITQRGEGPEEGGAPGRVLTVSARPAGEGVPGPVAPPTVAPSYPLSGRGSAMEDVFEKIPQGPSTDLVGGMGPRVGGGASHPEDRSAGGGVGDSLELRLQPFPSLLKGVEIGELTDWS